MILPNFLIIGAQKSATSAIYKQLKVHSEIYLPERKEIAFFSDEKNYQKGSNYYASFFKGGKNAKAIGEATPNYLHIDTVPKRIHALIPEVKLICCLRNPIERAYSAFLMQISKGSEPIGRTFEEAIFHSPYYIEYGMYATQLERYYKYFSRDQLKIILFEDLKEKPMSVYNEICVFLDIKKFSNEEFVVKKTNRGGIPKSKLVQSATNKLYKFRNRVRDTSFSFLVTNKIVDNMSRNMRNRVSRWNRKVGSYPELQPQIKERLIPLFEEENKRLEQIIHRDLSIWNSVTEQN